MTEIIKITKKNNSNNNDNKKYDIKSIYQSRSKSI